MNKIVSLKNSREFNKVFENKNSYANKYLVIYLLENNLNYNRLGITVSKKIGNSVVRHRIKRLIKENYRLNNYLINKGFDIVIIARIGIIGKTYKEIESALIHLFKLHNIIKKEVIE